MRAANAASLVRLHWGWAADRLKLAPAPSGLARSVALIVPAKIPVELVFKSLQPFIAIRRLFGFLLRQWLF